MASVDHYRSDEVIAVTQLDKSLFPNHFEISDGARDTLRYLCMFSQTELKPTRQITSHRRIIGPVIVFLKKLTWPLLEIHLRDVFRSLQEFNTRSVEAQAGMIMRNEILAQELAELKRAQH